MNLKQTKELDNFSRATLWFVIGVVVMGLLSIGIEAKSHSDIEYCLSSVCLVWVRDVDNSSCKIIVEQLNATKNNTIQQFYMCR